MEPMAKRALGLFNHSNVIGWPISASDRKAEEAAQMSKALKLLEMNLVTYTAA